MKKIQSQYKQIIIINILILYLINPFNLRAEEKLLFGSTATNDILYAEGDIAKGFVADVFNEMMRRSNIKAEVRLYPFKRVNIYLKTGKLDGTIAIFYSKERETYLSYVKTPVIVSRTMVFSMKSSNLKFRKVEDLYNRNVGKLAGWSVANPAFNDAINKNLIHVEETTEFKHSLLKLLRGRIDYFAGPEQLTKMGFKKLNAEDKAMVHKTPLAPLSTHMAVSRFSKKVKNPELMAKKMDNLLKKMISDGTLEKYLKKYNLKSG